MEKRDIRIPERATRDILHVVGRVVSGDSLDVFVCHMPSRNGGEARTEPFRVQTAKVLRRAVDSLIQVRRCPNILIMGDFNDYPSDRSLKKVLGAASPEEEILPRNLYNLMIGKKPGTYHYHGQWGIFDQLIVSGNLLTKKENVSTSWDKAGIVWFPFLLEEDGKYGGDKPFRTYNGMKYQGGYSDHLPVRLDFLIRDDKDCYSR